MIKHGIIPHTPVYYDTSTFQVISESAYLKQDKKLDLKAIAIFAACGFFLDEDTHYEGVKALQPATEYEIVDGKINIGKKYFEWHYAPKSMDLKQATEAFKVLFESIVARMSAGKNVILPLSGGLDSRSLAGALKKHPQVQSYSYEFAGGESETWYSKKIAEAEKYPFTGYTIQKSYLWERVMELGKLSNCASEFTHPRQMAVIEKIEQLGNCFMLGHWGDVLFDGMGVHDDMGFDEQVDMLYKKVLKKGGKELGSELWKQWALPGEFSTYLRDRLSTLLADIKIENANSRIRAFKSLYWAPRWTSVNIGIFRRNHVIALPYYDNEMCEFICNIPESLLADRQIQIEYLKLYAPELAKIKWQGFGLDLYNYQNFFKWYNIPNRLVEKTKRILANQHAIKRNWELQFLGESNKENLFKHIYHPEFLKFVDKKLVDETYENFIKDGVYYSHPLSILLTLSVFNQLHRS